MSFGIVKLDTSTYNTNYFSAGFRSNIEDHLDYLRGHDRTASLSVMAMDSRKYIGDLYGLLTSLGIADEFHWIVMRVNGMHSTQDYTGSVIDILVPDENILALLLSRYLSRVG